MYLFKLALVVNCIGRDSQHTRQCANPSRHEQAGGGVYRVPELAHESSSHKRMVLPPPAAAHPFLNTPSSSLHQAQTCSNSAELFGCINTQQPCIMGPQHKSKEACPPESGKRTAWCKAGLYGQRELSMLSCLQASRREGHLAVYFLEAHLW